ncbi:MqnA/MqnD/SBP family protein [Methylacidiphilum caldifontis]|uniref:1,4-dihydroxy-6-naphtoate synthase n=1 Tax=Methylacidiphilum caldifontis TaxID=2795386 RepID=A0A4Y8PC64_9BACT|nr:MqnA/MqnD/SBP family protein [Methylacidiphilum caldifontis]QSR87978.1 ABC transporter substrate-binding protein [Methylacidiphilum caldifontis]TFE68741.1 ABC transporter substrate-binding protein [Methylacidiphilum caldifontis]
MNSVEITLGHSPDADDAFMFYALSQKKIPLGNYIFKETISDIETLNNLAMDEKIDLTALSIYTYCKVADRYVLMNCGASMGEGYGPRLVAKHKFEKKEMSQKKIAIPGLHTSALLALCLYLGKRPKNLDLMVCPFDQVFMAVEMGSADIGLVIHEGQISYLQRGLELCEDLGWWWKQTTGLPLPLGGNAIRRALGVQRCRELQSIVRQSIEWALKNRNEALQYAQKYSRGIEPALTDQFVAMYVNERTIDYGPEGKEAILQFIAQAKMLGMVDPDIQVEFVE